MMFPWGTYASYKQLSLYVCAELWGVVAGRPDIGRMSLATVAEVMPRHY